MFNKALGWVKNLFAGSGKQAAPTAAAPAANNTQQPVPAQATAPAQAGKEAPQGKAGAWANKQSERLEGMKSKQSGKVFSATGLTDAFEGKREGDLGVKLDNSKTLQAVDAYHEDKRAHKEAEKLKQAAEQKAKEAGKDPKQFWQFMSDDEKNLVRADFSRQKTPQPDSVFGAISASRAKQKEEKEQQKKDAETIKAYKAKKAKEGIKVTDEEAQQYLAMRRRVEANIAESKKARESSNIDRLFEIEKDWKHYKLEKEIDGTTPLEYEEWLSDYNSQKTDRDHDNYYSAVQRWAGIKESINNKDLAIAIKKALRSDCKLDKPTAYSEEFSKRVKNAYGMDVDKVIMILRREPEKLTEEEKKMVEGIYSIVADIRQRARSEKETDPRLSAPVKDDSAFSKRLTEAQKQLMLRDPASLTEEEKQQVITIRQFTSNPDPKTLMQKFISIEDLNKYLTNQWGPSVKGYVAKQEDVGHLKTSRDIISTMRLDYTDTSFTNPEHTAVGFIVFKAKNPEALKITYNQRMGGDVEDPYPFKGNGITKTLNGQLIPEYTNKVENGKNIWLEMTEAELYIADNKKEEPKLVGKFDPKSKKFIKV